MRVLLIYNASDAKCGFRNFGDQTAIALRRAGLDLTVFDGTYPKVYFRQQIDIEAFFPPDVGSFDVVHLIYSAITMNHYVGADWRRCWLTSWWDGGPSDTTCPFDSAMQIRWAEYPRPGYHFLPYPIPDWIAYRPQPSSAFMVGTSTVRGDGVDAVKALCAKHGWAYNHPAGAWLSVDEEVQRLARSVVNVCWYHTTPLWKTRSGAVSMLLASGRPLIINQDPMVDHLWEQPDLYHTDDGSFAALERALLRVYQDWRDDQLVYPVRTCSELSWTRCALKMQRVWEESR